MRLLGTLLKPGKIWLLKFPGTKYQVIFRMKRKYELYLKKQRWFVVVVPILQTRRMYSLPCCLHIGIMFHYIITFYHPRASNSDFNEVVYRNFTAIISQFEIVRGICPDIYCKLRSSLLNHYYTCFLQSNY